MKNNKLHNFLTIFFISIVIICLSVYGFNFFSPNYIPKNSYPTVSKNLQQHVYNLSHEISNIDTRYPEKMLEATNYIEKELVSCGYKIKRQPYKTDKGTVENIIARKDWEHNGEVIILGAHYDTMRNPGADDNASGMAVMLELARILSNKETSLPVEFVAFANEEPPYFQTDLMGSRHYVNMLKEENRLVKIAIILEMVGYYKDTYFSQEYLPPLGFLFPNKANFVALIGNGESAKDVKSMKEIMARESSLPVETLAMNITAKYINHSDHSSFWRVGMNSIMITDTAFFRNPNYHKPTDTHDTLDYERMSELVAGLEKVLTQK